MGKKGSDRHARRFQATQQAMSKFKQKSAKFSFWGFNMEIEDPKSNDKLITKIIK